MSFSDLHGFTTPRTLAQTDSMDRDLRVAIWNGIHFIFFEGRSEYVDAANQMLRGFFMRYQKRPIDAFRYGPVMNEMRTAVLKDPWFQVYNILTDIPQWAGQLHNSDDIYGVFNLVMETELGGWKFVSGVLTSIVDQNEVDEVEEAIDSSDEDASGFHIKRALELFSDRDSPDYVNAIVQSIQAVESIARRLSNKKTLGDALDELKSQGLIDEHPALVSGWKKIYGYTSDKDGFRHGGVGVPAIDQAYARYFIITCSSMVNLLRSLETTKS